MSQDARNNPEAYEPAFGDGKYYGSGTVSFDDIVRICERDMQRCVDAGCEGPDHNEHE